MTLEAFLGLQSSLQGALDYDTSAAEGRIQ